MPYIKLVERDRAATNPETPGELNFALTQVVLTYIKHRGGVSYTTINECVGALECAKLELYRRSGATYEDRKCWENGDVYPPPV